MEAGIKAHYYNEFDKIQRLKANEIDGEKHRIVSLEEYIKEGEEYFELKGKDRCFIEYLEERNIKFVATPNISGGELIIIKG